MKTERVSRGELTREVTTRRDVRNPEGARVDAIDHIEWVGSKDEIRNLRTPVLIIGGGPQERGIQACEVQNMFGEFYVRQTEKSIACDVMTPDKVKRAGGILTTKLS